MLLTLSIGPIPVVLFNPIAWFNAPSLFNCVFVIRFLLAKFLKPSLSLSILETMPSMPDAVGDTCFASAACIASCAAFAFLASKDLALARAFASFIALAKRGE